MDLDGPILGLYTFEVREYWDHIPITIAFLTVTCPQQDLDIE